VSDPAAHEVPRGAPGPTRSGASPAPRAVSRPAPSAATRSAVPPDSTLVDLLDRVIDRGVTISGDVVLGVAGVDLVHVGLRLVLKGVDGPEDVW
jgi:hypothetical protein